MITAPELDRIAGIRHAFFTREGGVSEGIYESLNVGIGSRDDPQAVQENRARVAQRLDVAPDLLLTPYQIHSATAVVVDGPFGDGERPKADAFVTATPGVAVGVSTADCGPVLFADAEAGVVAAAHAGWRGAYDGILEATLDAMEGLGAQRGRTVAVLGPTISQVAYEVGPDFIERFLTDRPADEIYFTPSERTGHAMFDLPRYVVDRLVHAGVEEAHRLDMCTYRNPELFYSYRRAQHSGEPDYGRLVSAIALAAD
ncbi:peptidoglycan editing factor PgeF [Amorphus orientalis]|uniref:Purine nucleoside phosphorylase n=1 Tax=Amorphus orientalis TaxID=649198 RepID=A0AAE3VM55_9HYPH|nr:peptidoglycan editing factor PgeF [Amorphus orientalis]MDQ0314226.1 YfiH family protein [Amorphus orientalis]